ncbi:hypothetical protein [Bradyrhizobium uaiense]|uniref:Uncharacterized protein n=1 Tax=Bradyrhizobium uaiense TaxID=2594946 RepID=A0A6P1B9C9_9BRAD|nr:hypothetical protein [Bradyrhizobium uaiense]NEU94943.1 hypothetical protein [Bradyrhizobium uaiense]
MARTVRGVTAGLIAAVASLAGTAGSSAQGLVNWSGFCALDAAQPKPCSVSDTVATDGQHDLRFSFGSIAVSFFGRNAGAWWSGELNGRPAMGYERNRGHTVLSATDLKTTFEWCDKLSADRTC